MRRRGRIWASMPRAAPAATASAWSAKKAGAAFWAAAVTSNGCGRKSTNSFSKSPRLKHLAYTANVTLQIADSGELEKYDVELLSGDPQAVQILNKIFAEKRRLSRPRPLEAASLVKLRIKSVL